MDGFPIVGHGLFCRAHWQKLNDAQKQWLLAGGDLDRAVEHLRAQEVAAPAPSPRRSLDPYRHISRNVAQELRTLHSSGATADELTQLYRLDYANVMRVLPHAPLAS